MEQQEMQEERRARNFVWAAAGHYGLEPLFLAYASDGTADMYLNMIIGLSYKWYDAEKLETFFHMLGGRQEELYQGMLWIGLEQALYEKEKIHRPVLVELRQEYAQENLARYRVLKEYELIDQLRNGHCAEILGKSSGLSGRTEELLRELTFTGEMGIEQILAKMKDDLSWEESGNGGTMEKARHYLLQFSRQGDEEKDRAYIEGCFGANIYTPREQKLLEDEVCTENHKNSHLYITRGYPMEEPVTQTGSNTTVRHQEESTEREATDRGETASHTAEDIGQVFGSGAINKRESREIREFRENSRRQAEKNRQHYEKNRTVYENSIRRMTEKLRLELNARMDDVPVQARQGNIRASQVWRALYLEDPRVFEKREEVSEAGFSVDILIDASSSRKNSQEQIAAQAYILAKSLDLCGIPLQVYSYCSIRGYTVLRLFQSYGENRKAEEVFSYVAAGNNRDGLALRGAGHLMAQSEQEKKLLLVLTDGSPQDDQIAAEGAFYKNREYTDQIAVEDTTEQVQQLKRRNIQVVGIFMGTERGLQTAHRIFGRDFVRIQNIQQFAEIVGKILQEKIREM